MMIDAHFWQFYCDPYFKFGNAIPTDEFVIITAQNPASKKLSEEENRIRNRCLQCDLAQYNFEFVSVGNNDFSWLEESFACQIPLHFAIELAKKYQQNAIYYVQDEQLYLLSCLPDCTNINLGNWLHRIR